MIRLPPTSIQLSESDVHYHLQRVMLRHALVADFEKLELDYSYEDEDGKRHLDSPNSLQESCSSSVVLDSGSDIIAEAASIRGRSYIGCRYKTSHWDGTPQPEAGSSSSMPQLDGASFIASSDLNVENVFDAMLASPHHSYSRLYSTDQTPTTHFQSLIRGRGAAGRKGYGSCASEERNYSPDPLVRLSPVDADHLSFSDPAVGSFDLERPCSFKIRRKSQKLTAMCSKYMLDLQVSQDKQGASLVQLPPRTPLYQHAVVRKGSMLRFAQSASFDSSDITSVCEADVRGLPTEGVKNSCDGVFDIHREEHEQVNALNMAKASLLYASSRRQPSLPAYLPSGYNPNTRYFSLSTNKTCSSEVLRRSFSWLRSPDLQLSLETRLAMLDLSLPRTSFSVSYFPTAYERTRIGKSPKTEDKKDIVGELTVSTNGSDPDLGYPAGELNLGLTASIVTSGPQIYDSSSSSDSEVAEPFHKSDTPRVDVASIRLSQIPSYGGSGYVTDEETASTVLAITDSEDSNNEGNVMRFTGPRRSRPVSISSTPTRHSRHSHETQNYDDALLGFDQAPIPMARIEIVPETRVAYTVFPGWEHEAHSQVHRRLIQGNRLIDSSPAAPISRERRRRMSFPGTATLDRPRSAVPSLGNATEPSNMDRSAHNGLSFRPDIDRNVFQRVLRESIAFQRRFRALVARLDNEDDGPEDFGLAEVRSRPMGDWYRR
ncbi:hypothetical protein VTN00DRAFT_8325 [Thermoascus crustaceus]|uniref:uncharacterized protein n=1 Tax=Thermoascus crustaceus TaxID=5088 RepID=UPI0037435E57